MRLPAILTLTLLGLGGCGGGARFEPVAAHVAIEIVGEGVARDGVLQVEPDREFRAHAILEVERPDGTRHYFTDAPGLELDGRRIAAEQISPWEGPLFAQVLWLTLEAPRRWAEVDAVERVERLRFEGFARPEWGRGWVADVRLGLRSQEDLDVHAADDEIDFGTRFLQAWVELSPQRDALLPEQRLKSPGPEALVDDPSSVTTVVVRSAAALGTAQRVFGLMQLEVAEDAEAGVADAIRALHERGLAFQAIEVLRDLTNDAGRDYGALEWSPIELGSGVRWGETVNPGDLLQVGDRWVVLFEDTQSDGLLDPEDRALDFDRGAAVVRLADVFVGEGEVVHASLGD